MIGHGRAVSPAAIVLLMAVHAAAAGRDQTAPIPLPLPDHGTRTDAATLAEKRLREGTRLVDQIGTFKLSADRAAFTTADRQNRFKGLPNLNLERIVRTLRDQPEQLVWSVSGTVTEYQGTNYILITRAVLKSKQSRHTLVPAEPSSPSSPSTRSP